MISNKNKSIFATVDMSGRGMYGSLLTKSDFCNALKHTSKITHPDETTNHGVMSIYTYYSELLKELFNGE